MPKILQQWIDSHFFTFSDMPDFYWIHFIRRYSQYQDLCSQTLLFHTNLRAIRFQLSDSTPVFGILKATAGHNIIL